MQLETIRFKVPGRSEASLLELRVTMIAGYWLWQVKSREEAIEWVKRCPNPMAGDSEIEIRQVYEVEDFGPELTPERRAQVEQMCARIAKKP